MALIICPECGGKMSDTASSCPHCGFNRNAYAQRQQAKQIMMDMVTAAPDRIGVYLPLNFTYHRQYAYDNYYGHWNIETPHEVRRLIKEPKICWTYLRCADCHYGVTGGLHYYDIGANRKVRICPPSELKSLSPIVMDVEPGHIYEVIFTDAATGREYGKSEPISVTNARIVRGQKVYGDWFYTEREVIPHVRIML